MHPDEAQPLSEIRKSMNQDFSTGRVSVHKDMRKSSSSTVHHNSDICNFLAAELEFNTVLRRRCIL